MKRVVACLALGLSFVFSSAADSIVVFNEIMFHPASNEAALEWIELHNQNAVDVDISGWSITGGVEYTFPEGTRIRGRGYLVVASDPTSLTAASGAAGLLGPFRGRLGNDGERVELIEKNQRVMDSIRYGVDGLWPVGADGAGVSLAKRHPDLGTSAAENWTVSAELGGTPGRRNFPTGGFEVPPGLVSYWSFDETSGLALDPIGGNSGALGSGVARVNGLVGSGAVTLASAANAAISVGRGVNNNFSARDGLTIEALIRPTWDGTGRATLFRKAGDNRGSLVSYWSFDESVQGTNVALDPVTGNHGSFRGTATRTNGLVGNGGLFLRNNTTEGVNVGTGVLNSFSFSNGVTLAAWIRPQWAGVSNSHDAIFSKDDTTNRLLLSFQYDSSNSVGLVSVPPGPVLAFGLNVGGRYTELDMPLDGSDGRPTLAQLEDGAAHQVAGTFDSTTGRFGIWVDGTLRYFAVKVGAIKSGGSAPAFIGNRGTTGGQPFTGVIDEVAIWASALGESELAAFAQGVAPPEIFPVTGPGNRIQFGFRNAGDTDFTDPVVTTTPVLVFGAMVGGVYRELELSLDGQGGHPMLATLKDGQLHHVAATYQAATGLKSIAVDGVVYASEMLGGSLDTGGLGLAFLGNSASNGLEAFQGTLDEMSYWTRALSTAELALHARQARSGKSYLVPPEVELPSVAFSELPSSATNPYWIELVNHGSSPVQMEGVLLSRSGGGLYVFPAGTLAAGSFLVVTQSQFGFRPLPGDLLSLFSKDREALVDAVRVTSNSQARVTPGTSVWRSPSATSPDGANSFRFQDEIVINEIFYHAPPVFAVAAEYTNLTLVAIDSTWKFEQSGQDLETGWREPGYDDLAWSSGSALFYNETAALPAPKNTPLTLGPLTYYFRQKFQFAGSPAGILLNLRPLVDDGSVVYLNGAEILRTSMRAGPVAYTNLATSVGNAAFGGPFTVVATNLVQGENLLAVEVHQAASNSDDVVFGLEVLARIPSRPAQAFQENPEQWVELYNRSANAVDLSGWRFDSGITYQFSNAVAIPAGGYLVVARDAAALQGRYPGIPIVGPWEGRLSGNGERLVLNDASGNPADEVRFYASGRWPAAADGGGSSLELLDSLADNSRGEAWAASDELAKSTWRTITYRGLGSQRFTTPGDAEYNELVIGLLDAGEVLLDDVTVTDLTANPPLQIIQNSTFEAGLSKWRVIGNHKGETAVDPDDPTNHVMRMVATGMTEHMNNHAETTVKDGTRFVTLNPSRIYEISLRARWVSGSPQLNTRLFFNRLPRTTILPMPTRWGTPGARNSRAVENNGPTFSDLRHEPVVPSPGDPVIVSVRAEDPQQIASATLWWSTNSTEWNSQVMTLGADGRYAGSIGGHPAGRAVQFYVEAIDGLGATNTYPAEGRRSRSLYQVDDSRANLPLAHNVRIVMTVPDAALLLTPTNLMSNGRIGCTVIYDEKEVIYDCGVRLKGSEHGRPQQVRISFNLEFPADHLFRGVHATIALDRSGGGGRFGQDEILINHIVYRAGGVPALYNDLVREIGPQTPFTGPAILLMARYNPIFLDSQFTDGAQNPVFEVEYYYGQSAQVPPGPEGLKVPQEAGVTGNQISDQGDDKENYRLGFIIKNARDRDDFETFIPYAKMFSLSGNPFLAAADQRLDVDEWLRCFALGQLCGAGDNYTGSGDGHNLMVYVRPSDQKLVHLIWDTDFAFTRSATDSLEQSGDLGKLLTKPANRRTYFAHIQDILATTFNADYMAYWTDHYDNFTPGQSFSTFLDYIRTRSNYARGVLPKQISFGINSNGGQPFLTNSPVATLVGRAWIDVQSIRLAGSTNTLNLTWTSVTNWAAQVPVALGSNTLIFEAYHRDGHLLTNVAMTVVSSALNGGTDTDGDGIPDMWETIYDLNPGAVDSEGDPDRDGLTNGQEFLAGTNPRDPRSRLQIDRVSQGAGEVQIGFSALTGRSYTVQYREAFDGAPWQTLVSFAPALSDRVLDAQDAAPQSRQRYYRLITPSSTP